MQPWQAAGCCYGRCQVKTVESGGELISNLPPSLRYQTSPQLVASLYRGTTNSSNNNWEIYKQLLLFILSRNSNIFHLYRRLVLYFREAELYYQNNRLSEFQFLLMLIPLKVRMIMVFKIRIRIDFEKFRLILYFLLRTWSESVGRDQMRVRGL